MSIELKICRPLAGGEARGCNSGGLGNWVDKLSLKTDGTPVQNAFEIFNSSLSYILHFILKRYFKQKLPICLMPEPNDELREHGNFDMKFCQKKG
jgi:hypothetical protein